MVEVLAVVVGFLLGLVPGWIERRRSNRATLLWMRISATHNEQCLAVYARDKIFSPQYRLMVDFSDALPRLLADKCMTVQEAEIFSGYLAGCEEVNRCLDELAAIVASSRTLDEAVYFGQPQKSRADLKVQNLTGPYRDGPSRAENARRVIGDALARAGL